MPLWEGYDEWAHFGYIQQIVNTNHPLVERTEPVSRELWASMNLAPAPWNTGKPFITQDDFWRLPAEERAARADALRKLPPGQSKEPEKNGAPIYEALQPPLYYWIASIPYRLVAHRPIADRVFVIRYVSLAIAYVAIPLVFLIGERVFRSVLPALLVSILLAMLPELMIDICRVGNECLGIVLFSWLTLLVLTPESDALRKRTSVWTGIALGLGLLTKAYFLTAVPALLVIYAVRAWRGADRLEWIRQAASVFGIAFAIAGWWYVRNRVTTGAWSGLLESAKLAHHTPGQFLEAAAQVNWRTAMDSILLSHIWFGGWSSLQVRSWIYHLVFFVIGASIVGVLLALRDTEKRKSIGTLAAIYGFFWLGQLYNVLLLFMAKGASTSMGWYMYCVVAAELALLVLGIQTLLPKRFRPWAISILILLAGALDFYTVTFASIPYYAGLTSHAANTGAVRAFHFSSLADTGVVGVMERLSLMKAIWLAPGVQALLYLVYAAATVLLIALPFRLLVDASSPDKRK
jgi:hypothetical protein